MVKVYTQLEENEYRKEYKVLKTMQLQHAYRATNQIIEFNSVKLWKMCATVSRD